MSKPPLWTKDFLVVSTANFLMYITFYLLIATIPLFAAETFHASPSEAGLASGILVIGTLLARLFTGKSIEHVGRKKVLYIGFISLLVTNLLYFAVNHLIFLYVIRFLNGAALGIAGTATATIVANIIPHERRGEGIGYYALSTTLAAAFGPFIGIFINQKVGFGMNFVLCSLLIIVSFIASFLLKIPEAELTHEQRQQARGITLSSFFEPKAIPISFISLVVGLGYASVLTFMSTYTIEIHLVEAASFFFVVYAAAILVSRPFTGRWFDLKGENVVLYPAFIVFAMGLAVLSQAHHGAVLLLAGALVGFGYGTFMSSAQAIAIKVSPKHRMGLANSTFFIFVDGGIGFGPFLLGFLIPLLGYRGLYEAMALVVFACVPLYYFLHGRTAGKGRPSVKGGVSIDN